MSGELMRVVYQCVKCGREFETRDEVVEHLSAWKRPSGCANGRNINIRVRK